MKKIYVSSLVVMMAVLLSYCHTAKKATAAPTVAAVTYQSSIAPIIMNSCAPCHIPSKGGNKEALDNYANVKKDIDGILHRIQLDPAERGFMPSRHPKLSDSTIAVIKQWKDNGLVEK
jgi:cytochrome c553